MHISKSRGTRFIVMFISLAMIVFGISISDKLQDEELYAATTTEDIKIIDFAPTGAVVSWLNFENSAYVLSEDGYVYYNKKPSDPASYFVKVKHTDGTEVSNVKKIYNTGASNTNEAECTAIFAVTNDNKLYALQGYKRVLGIGAKSYDYQTSPILVDTSGIPGTIVEMIGFAATGTLMLMDTGDVYATGEAYLFGYEPDAVPPGMDIYYNYTFVKTGVSNMKDITASNTNQMLAFGVDNNGFVWGWGHVDPGFHSGIPIWSYSPKRLKYQGGELDKKVIALGSRYAISYGNGGGVYLVTEDGKLYFSDAYSGDSDKMTKNSSLLYGVGGTNIYEIHEATALSYFDFKGVTQLTATPKDISFIQDGTFYMAIADPLYNGSDTDVKTGLPYRDPESNQSSRIQPYVKGQINEKTKVIKAMGAYADTWILRDDNKLFFRGNPVKFKAEIGIEGKKPDNTKYESSEKYKNDVTLYFNKDDDHASNVMKYKVRDLPDGIFGAEMAVPASEDEKVKAIEGTRIYKEYKVFYEGQEDQEKATFTVDIYKQGFADVSVENNGSYVLDDALQWDATNGLEGNVVKATLLKPGASVPVEIDAGYVLDVAGSYTLNLSDSYGNSYAASFQALSVPKPQSMKFVSQNNMKYNSANTIAGGTLGSIELLYLEGEAKSSIATASIVGGNTEGYFSVSQDAGTKVWSIGASKNVPAGTYTLKFTGTDLNNASFRNFTVSIEVVKADNPMKWDEISNQVAQSGMYVDENITVGVVDMPAEMSVTYALKEAVAGIGVDASTGAITVSSMSADSVAFVVQATPAGTTNYVLEPIEVALSVRKRTLSLKTVSVVGGVSKDHNIIDLGSPMPSFKVEASAALPSGVTLTQPSSFSVYDSGGKVVSKIVDAGTYTVKANYAADMWSDYVEAWTLGSVEVKAILIDDTNAANFYTLHKDDGSESVYTPGTWSRHNIIITPKHAVYDKMSMQEGTYIGGAQTLSQEGSNNVSLKFKTSDEIVVATSVNNVKIDKTKPSVDGITYTTNERSVLADLLNTITFNHFFAKEQTASFQGSDTGGSGLSTYHYILSELDEEGNVVGTPKEADANSVSLPKNMRYKLEVTAKDTAGNISESRIEYIHISDETPTINVTATLSGTSVAYDETTWTGKAIDIVLSSPQEIATYAWSTDGITYEDLEGSTFTIANTANINNKTYYFKGTSLTGVDGTKSMRVKMDKDVPVFTVAAVSNGNDYTGTKSEYDVVLAFSQTSANISGVSYYVCEDANIAKNDPTISPAGWTKLDGTSKRYDTTVDKTYYYKAVSNAKVASSTAISQKIWIEKKVVNPDNLNWTKPGNEELAYGSLTPLTIENTGGKAITYTVSGGEGCLSYNENTKTVTATNGVCTSNMSISAQVGNYETPLTKTISTKKAPLEIQTMFKVNGATVIEANILKGGAQPEVTMAFVSGKGLVGSEIAIGDPSELGDYAVLYVTNGETKPTLDTSVLGTYLVSNNLNVGSVSIASFTSKYDVKTLPATLHVNDNNIPDADLYSISGPTGKNSWYTGVVTITPKSSAFVNMGIDGAATKTTPQSFPSGAIIDKEHSVTLLFVDGVGNEVSKRPIIKIDSKVPELQASALSNGASYNGAQSGTSITVNLSQPNANVSGVSYYVCDNEVVSQSDPQSNPSGWTQVVGTSITYDTTQNKTYYYKAVSKAGLTSSEAISQKIWILLKENNPVGMDWTTPGAEDIAYGEQKALSIKNTNGKAITYTSSGGEDCLSLDTTSGEVTAISGTCSSDMVVTAQVGNYQTPLTKTLTTHRVQISLQSSFKVKNKDVISATILKGGTQPLLSVNFIEGHSLVGDEASKTIMDIGSYAASYSKDGVTTTSINTANLGVYEVTNKLKMETVTIPNFAKKYDVKQLFATLSINDNNLPDEDLYSIDGPHVNDVWYSDAVRITPIHEDFNMMGINGGTSSSSVQTFPSTGEVTGKHDIALSFKDEYGSTINKAIKVQIDAKTPAFTLQTKSNGADYASGSSSMYDVDVKFVDTSLNLSKSTYYLTTDVEANGNLKANAVWIEANNFTIVKSATYYFKAISGAGLDSTPRKFVANINKPDTAKIPSISVTSNGKTFVADGSTWAKTEVSFAMSGNSTGYEVCTSTESDREVSCADSSSNWTSIDNEVDQKHSVHQDQDINYYWFRNKIAGFTTTASSAYGVMIDSVNPDTPQIDVTLKQSRFMSMFSSATGSYHKQPVNVEMSASDDRSGIASILYDVYDDEGSLLSANQSYKEVLLYEDINIQLRAKAIDKTGNISALSDFVAVAVDTQAPSIHHVIEDKTYYIPYVFISYADSGSGIDVDHTTYTNNGNTEKLGNNTLFNGSGNVDIAVSDVAGNVSSLSFTMAGLPQGLDCSQASFALIDTVKAQYEDVKGYLNDAQKKVINDWVAKASNSCTISNPENNVTVENEDAKIPENTVLVVDVITTTVDDKKLVLAENEEVKMAYDVYFKNGESVFKDLEGTNMKVKLPLGAYKASKGLRLVAVEADGTSQDIVYVVEGDYAVFSTNELKKYAFIAEKGQDPNINVDFNCDGTPDLNIDTNNDGIPNINIDTIGDGKANYNVDIEGATLGSPPDGIPDVNIGPLNWKTDKCVVSECGVAYCTSTYYKPYLNIDTDDDGRPDINIDLNKDKEADINIDTDFDNIPNIEIDSTGDGEPDINIDDNDDGEADRNLLDVKAWNPEFDVETPIKYDTMKDLVAEEKPNPDEPVEPTPDEPVDPTPDKPVDPTPDKPTVKPVEKPADKVPDKVETITPTVKGSYTNALGGAVTGEADIVPVLCIMLLGSWVILWRFRKKQR